VLEGVVRITAKPMRNASIAKPLAARILFMSVRQVV
jgi:hypothetical protein